MKMKRILSSLLAAFLAIGIVSMNVAASDASVSSADELTSAISNASSGDTITLNSDITISSVITITTDITLDLNGHTLTLDSSSNSNGARLLYIASNGSLTVRDSGTDGMITNTSDSITNNGSNASYGLFDVYGTLTIESGSYKSVSTGDGALIKGRDGGTIIISGGSFYTSDAGTNTSYSSWSGNGIIIATSCKISISSEASFTSKGDCVGTIVLSYCTGLDGDEVSLDGLTITTESTVGIELYGTDATLSNMNITVANDGDPDFYGTAVGVSGDSIVTIESGTYSAPYAVYIYSSGGTVIINGGTFTGTSAVLKADVSSYYANSSDIVVYDGDFNGEISLTTSSGTDSSGDIYSASLVIYHGEFTDSSASEYVVTASYTDEDGNTVNTYVVSETDDEGNTVTYVHALVLIEAVDATCTEDGNIEYYYCTYDSCESPYFEYIESEEAYEQLSASDVVLSATGHTYGSPTVVWSDDYTTLTVTWTCVYGDDEYTVTTTDIATEEDEDGTIWYTAVVEGPNGGNFTCTASAEGTSSDTTDSVDTGDASHVYAWLWTMLAAGFVLIGKGVYTIKRNR